MYKYNWQRLQSKYNGQGNAANHHEEDRNHNRKMANDRNRRFLEEEIQMSSKCVERHSV